MLLLALAIAPGLAICIFIYWKDKFDREPRQLLLLSFFLGVFSVVPAIVLEMIVQLAGLNANTGIAGTAVFAFFGVGLVEESCKYFFTRIPYRNKAFNEPFDGITYSVMVAMGFATLENALYVYEGGLGVAFSRMLTAVPAHATFGVIIGYYLGLEKMRGIPFLGLRGLFFAALLHAAYDFFLMISYIPGMWVGALLSLYLGVRFSLRAIRLHQAASPFRTAAKP
jgi:RsiW-degrading membrane proteinase PrsW (M82 family)